jgi:viroplasmin and RNaseH domain-containing protein
MTIDELLKSMLTLESKQEKENRINNSTLANTAATWAIIGSRGDFSEMSFASDAEKEVFLKEWIADNPYSSI